ncbi:MAG: penicillin-binding protein 2 [Burkholderia sp.]|nr:penicillin-binding protein 2 [Burkholderia sp.]
MARLYSAYDRFNSLSSSKKNLYSQTFIKPYLPLWRSKLVVVSLLTAFLILIVRAFWIQIVNQNFYIIQGQKRYQNTINFNIKRERIVDRNGALLAVSLSTYEIWANPKLLSKEDYPLLARLLKMPINELKRHLKKKQNFVILKRQIDKDTVSRIEQCRFKGIAKINNLKRAYPEGESMAHVIGFTNMENNGQEGIELIANTILSGKPKQQYKVIHDQLGRIVSYVCPESSEQSGQLIKLTIDNRLQQVAYNQIKTAVLANQAKSGSVVILDARNGEILALANYPSFDPKDRSKLMGQHLRNHAVIDVFEPGSTIKPLIIALSIDSGKVHPKTIIDTGRLGTYKVGGSVIHDTSNYGKLTVSQALQKSSNIALAKLALDLPPQMIWNKYREYGIGCRPKIMFPGVASGKLRSYKKWRPIEQATMSYGYGLSMSLLQIAQMYTAYSSDGMLHSASLLKEDHLSTEKISSHRVTTPDTAAAIRSMLELAVSEGGTGKAARVDNYRVGGKTGTAWKQEGTSYAKGKYRSMFVGIAPISNPHLIVAVMINEPRGHYYGGIVAGPVFSSIMSKGLQLLSIPPDVPYTHKKGADNTFISR